MMFFNNKNNNTKKVLSLIFLIMLSCLINLSQSKWRYTKKTSWNGGNLLALTNNYLSCPNKYALTNFQAQKSGNNFFYKYLCYGACNGLRRMKKSYSAKTRINDTDRNIKRSLHYLDRHNVQCKNGYSLQSFGLKNKGNKIFYSYKCTETQCSKRLTYKSSTKNMGANETKFLPRLVVKVPKSHQVLTGFKFQRTRGNDFHYIINYCILDHSKKKKPKNNKKPAKKKNTPKVSNLPKPKNDDLPTVAPLTPAADLAIKKGNEFCAKHCVLNNANRVKQCMIGARQYNCKRCTIDPKINNPEKQMICEALCNAILPNNPCGFYGYTNGKKKNMSSWVLKKYGLKLIRRRRY